MLVPQVRVQQIVGHNHVSSVFQVLYVRAITEFVLLLHLYDEDSHTDASSELRQPKADCLAAEARDRVESEAEGLIIGRWRRFYSESPGDSDSLSVIN